MERSAPYLGLVSGAQMITYRTHEYVIITILTTSRANAICPNIPLIEGRRPETILKAEREVASRGGS
jgi:hypothetical protein